MDDKYIQYIIVDKTLGMSHGKLAAQVSHASMAFLSRAIQESICRDETGQILERDGCYFLDMVIDKEIYNNWLGGIFTKVILETKGKAGLEKVIERAEAAGFVENKDFFCIRDACLTELSPDETGTCFTCIGFRPMLKSEIYPVVKRLQLFKG